MVSDTPQDGRCNSPVQTKHGLELRFDDPDRESIPVTDIDLFAIRLVDPETGTTVDGAPEFHRLREYFWNDYVVTHLIIAPTAPMEAVQLPESVAVVEMPGDATELPADRGYDTVDIDELPADATWVDVSEVEVDYTNRASRLDGYCERYPMESGNCYVHQGGGAPEGNMNSLRHGLHAQRTTYYRSLDDPDRTTVEAWVDSWLGDAPFDRDHAGKVNELYRAAIDQHRALNAVDEFVEDGDDAGLTTEEVVRDEDGNVMYDDGGEPLTEERERAANLPYSRLDRDVISKLSKLGVMDSPEKQQADATESLAQKLSGFGE
jgi:hypothetical protein